MDHLLPHYEKELAVLRRSMGIFAERYPKLAASLGISGDHCEDPHVERLLQSFALLAADIDTRLHDSNPEFTHALLGTMCPQYLRSIPACAVARFDISDVVGEMTLPSRIVRGTALAAKAAACRFRTVYDVTLLPLSITSARYRATAPATRGVVLPADTTGLLSITFERSIADFPLEKIGAAVRVHISGPDRLTAAIADTMLLRTAAAFVEDSEGQWTALTESPVAAVGGQEAERLVEEDKGRQALRVLAEYFAFAKKFDFVDIDLAALAKAACFDQTLTLHLAVSDVHPDSRTAQSLKTMSADNLMLFCSPVVNLFKVTSLTLNRDIADGTYPIPTRNTEQDDGEFWSVDDVRVSARSGGLGTIQPFTSLMHGTARKVAGPYWMLMKIDPRTVPEADAAALGLVGLDGQSAENADFGQLTVDLTYSNGERPRTMAVGAEGGDLSSDQAAKGVRIAMLDAPTAPHSLPLDGDATWRLLAEATRHSIELTRAGLEPLKRLLRQFVRQPSEQARAVEALKNLAHRPKLLWRVGEPMPSLVRGLEVTVTLDEQAFVATSLSAFARALVPFFAFQVHVTNWVELVVISVNTGVELWRSEPASGSIPLI
jgi:type VI secretion system protein ImpG